MTQSICGFEVVLPPLRGFVIGNARGTGGYHRRLGSIAQSGSAPRWKSVLAPSKQRLINLQPHHYHGI